MRLSTTTLAVCLTATLSSCDAPIEAWTVRSDCHFRASQRNENFSIDELIAKIKKEENNDFAICTSPNAAKTLSNDLASCRIDLEACRTAK